ncbi:MAG: InlB B-repeat-containing protein, partial [Clostridia bacterium]|nr:InlB B-repeat-containing protein [Clostridia bacterium]
MKFSRRKLGALICAVMMLTQFAAPVVGTEYSPITVMPTTIKIDNGADDEFEFYKITFELNNGASDIIQWVEVSEDGNTMAEISLPQDPTPPVNKLFDGWYLKGGGKFNPSTSLIDDIILEARYKDAEMITVTVNYWIGDPGNHDDEPLWVTTRSYPVGSDMEEEIISPLYEGKVANPHIISYKVSDLSGDTTYDVYYGTTNTTYTLQYLFEELDGSYVTNSAYKDDKDYDGYIGQVVAAPMYDGSTPGFTFETSEPIVLEEDEAANIAVAKYSRNTNQIIYNANEGTPIGASIALYGASVTLPSKTSTGFTFAGWYSNENLVDGFVGAAGAVIPMPIEHTTQLYAKWTGLSVNYTVICWLEKANLGNVELKTDNIDQWQFVQQIIGWTGTAGLPITAVPSGGGPLAIPTNLTASQVNGATGNGANTNVASRSAFTPILALEGDGSSVLNVYFTRIEFTYIFNIGSPTGTAPLSFRFKAGMGPNTNLYSGTGYSFTAKYEDDISRKWPSSHNADFYTNANGTPAATPSNQFRGWNGGSSLLAGNTTCVSHRWTLTADLLPQSGTSVIIPAAKGSTVTATVNYWVQPIPGETPFDPYGSTVKTGTNAGYWLHSASQTISMQGSVNLAAKALEGFSREEQSSAVTNGAVINFYYTRNNYTLSFNTMGATVANTSANITALPAAQTVPFERQLTTLNPSAWNSDTTKTENGVTYYFMGWYTNAECLGTAFNFNVERMPAKNLTLFAKWEPKEVSVYVYFNSEDETDDHFLVLVGNKIDLNEHEEIRNPQRTGYIFGGWFKDEACTVPFAIGQPLDGETTIYAKWIPVPTQYTIKYVQVEIRYDGNGDPVYVDGKPVIEKTIGEVHAPHIESGTAGQPVTAHALHIGALRPLQQTMSIVLAEGENEIIFYYVGLRVVKYTVHYQKKVGGEWVDFTEEDYAPKTFDSKLEEMRVVVYPISIPGYYADPVAYEHELLLSDDQSVNHIYIHYYPHDSIPYIVEHWYWDDDEGDYVYGLTTDEEFAVKLGETIVIPSGIRECEYNENIYVYEKQEPLGYTAIASDLDSTITIKLFYLPNMVTVIYDPGIAGDWNAEDETYTVGHGSARPAFGVDPYTDHKPGYRFLGWDKPLVDPVTEDVIYTAQWIELVSISGTKTWVDGGKTHDNAIDLTLTLERRVKNAQPPAAWAPLTTGYTWSDDAPDTFTFDEVDKFNADGDEYEYRVIESEVQYYVTDYNDDEIINKLAELTIVKNADDEITYGVGDTIEYVVTVTNTGVVPLYNVFVRDSFPKGLAVDFERSTDMLAAHDVNTGIIT